MERKLCDMYAQAATSTDTNSLHISINVLKDVVYLAKTVQKYLPMVDRRLAVDMHKHMSSTVSLWQDIDSYTDTQHTEEGEDERENDLPPYVSYLTAAIVVSSFIYMLLFL